MADSCTPRSSSFSIANILSDDVQGVVKKRRKDEEKEETTNRRESEQDKKTPQSPLDVRSQFFQPYHMYFPALIGQLDGRDSHYPITATDPRILVRQMSATSSHRLRHTEQRHSYEGTETKTDNDTDCKTKVTTNMESELTNFAKNYPGTTTSDCESDNDTDTNVSVSVPGDNSESNNAKLKKKTRTVFSRHQIFYLESAFDTKRYLSSTERAEIATALSLTETQVKVWFQNRRNKWKSQVSGSDSGIPAERYPGVFLGSQYPLSMAPSHSALQLYRRPMFYF